MGTLKRSDVYTTTLRQIYRSELSRIQRAKRSGTLL